MAGSHLVRISATLSLLLLAPLAVADEFDHPHDDHQEAPLPPLGFSMTEGWFAPRIHKHFSPRNTPFLHPIGLESAFLDRDLFVTGRLARADEEDELEIEAELEWAVTRRLGFAFEVPYVHLNPDDGDRESGLGNIAIAPRVLIGETERFVVSANLEFAMPTGDDDRDLGSGEIGLAPSLSAWLDLGN